MPQVISENDLLQFLKAIERGQIVLRSVDDPQDVYAGRVRYVASNGWRMVVFNDANQWDYIEAVEAADGRAVDYGAIEKMSTAGCYEPDDDVSWARYGIPCYMRFRCKQCGVDLCDGPPFHPPFLCRSCLKAHQ
jgi:hypothetical protein